MEEVGISLDGSHGRAEFVRYVGHELALGPIGLHLFGDVPKDGNHPQEIAVPRKDGTQLGVDNPAVHLECHPIGLVHRRSGGPQQGLHGLDDLLPALVVKDRKGGTKILAHQLPGRFVQDTFRCRVDQDGMPLRVVHDNAVDDGGEDRLILGGLFLLLAQHLAQLQRLLGGKATDFGVADGDVDLAEDSAKEPDVVRVKSLQARAGHSQETHKLAVGDQRGSHEGTCVRASQHVHPGFCLRGL